MVEGLDGVEDCRNTPNKRHLLLSRVMLPKDPVWIILMVSLAVAAVLILSPTAGYCTTWLTPLPPRDRVETPTPLGLVLAAGGGSYVDECGVLLVFPERALRTDVVVTCWQEGPGADMPPGAFREPFNVDVWAAGTSERVTTFGAPVDLHVKYADREIAVTEEATVGLACYDRTQGHWRLLDNTLVDAAANVISHSFVDLCGTRFALVDSTEFLGPVSTPSQTTSATATHTGTPTVTHPSAPAATYTAIVAHTVTSTPAAAPTATATATKPYQEPVPSGTLVRSGSPTPASERPEPSAPAFLLRATVPWSAVLFWVGVLLVIIALPWLAYETWRQRHPKSKPGKH